MGVLRALKNLRGKDPTANSALEGLGLYSDPADPLGVFRTDQGGAREGQYHGFPVCPLFPNMIDYQFKSASDVETTNLWAQTAVGSGTGLTVQAGRGGWAKFVNGASDNDAYYYQANMAIQTLGASGKRTWFETEIKVKTVLQADLFVGLQAIIASGNLFDNRLNGIGFYMTDGSALLRCESVKAGVATSTQVSSGVTMVNDISVKISMLVVGTSLVYFYVNNVFKKVFSTNIPTADLAVTFGLRNGTDAANEFSINTIRTPMDR